MGMGGQNVRPQGQSKPEREERDAGNFTGGVKIMGNLPYYITTPIIMGILEKGVEAVWYGAVLQPAFICHFNIV